jgi:hypothetical protein
MVGCLVGFLFSSYGEEAGTVGKVREWIVGGLAGLTIAKAASLKSLLVTFAAGDSPNDLALVAGTAVTYVALGFFFMFFGRELILNVLLAESRSTRGLLEGTRQAGQVTAGLLQALPLSILYGIDDVADDIGKEKAEQQRAILYSAAVGDFLDKASEAAKSGSNLDWDVTSKVANLHYYRIYFENDKERKSAQAEIAYEWIQRALVIFPRHVELRIKLGDTLWILDRKLEAKEIFEAVASSDESPAYLKEWLGYYFLEIPAWLDLAIKYSEEFHGFFPEESDSLFNIAYAYFKKYCEELRERGIPEDLESPNRLKGLEKLSEGRKFQPAYTDTLGAKWTKPGEGLECLAADQEFRSLTGLGNPVAKTS